MPKFTSLGVGSSVQGGEVALAGQTAGDIMYADSATSITRLAIGSANQALIVSGGVPAWGGAGMGALVSKQEISGAAGTNLEWTSTDINTDGTYLIIFNLVSDGSGAGVSLFINNDTTATNYTTHRQYTDAGAVTAAQASDSVIASLNANESCTGQLWIHRDQDGYVHFNCVTTTRQGANNFMDNYTGGKNATVTNVTNIDLTAAANMSIGSWAALYKINN